MNMYEALKETATHIGAHPDLYDFLTTRIPTGDSDRACILGRLTQIVGAKWIGHADQAAQLFGHRGPGMLFQRVGEIILSQAGRQPIGGGYGYSLVNAFEVSRALFQYAEMYRHELESRRIVPPFEVIPPYVRAIFNPPSFAIQFGYMNTTKEKPKVHEIAQDAYV